jgi:hypothetical protein
MVNGDGEDGKEGERRKGSDIDWGMDDNNDGSDLVGGVVLEGEVEVFTSSAPGPSTSKHRPKQNPLAAKGMDIDPDLSAEIGLDDGDVADGAGVELDIEVLKSFVKGMSMGGDHHVMMDDLAIKEHIREEDAEGEMKRGSSGESEEEDEEDEGGAEEDEDDEDEEDDKDKEDDKDDKAAIECKVLWQEIEMLGKDLDSDEDGEDDDFNDDNPSLTPDTRFEKNLKVLHAKMAALRASKYVEWDEVGDEYVDMLEVRQSFVHSFSFCL